MAISPGDVIELDIEKPAAGGRMLARHHGHVVLVWGAIPGERAAVRIERRGKGVLYGEAVTVITSSADRRPAAQDWRCGGAVYAHIEYVRQRELKGQILQDAFARIGRMPLAQVPDVIGSPETGYRMRARLHAKNGQLGFFREESHDLCDAAVTGQLLPETCAWIDRAQGTLLGANLTRLVAVEIAENVPADERAVHLELQAGADPAAYAVLAEGLTGLSAEAPDRAGIVQLSGSAVVSDRLLCLPHAAPLRFERDVRAFFQGNRFLLESLVQRVLTLVPAGPVVDLYAGVGLFGLSLACARPDPVMLVEGDPVSGANLERNSAPFSTVAVRRSSVEAFLKSVTIPRGATVLVDPPRTGLSREAADRLVQHAPSTIVYVSCDPATLARDARLLVDAGYELGEITGIDLFPNTAHVEAIARFRR